MKLNEFKKTSADESAKKVDSKLNPETSIDINIISNKKSLKTKHIDFEQTPDSPKSFGSDSKGDKAKKVLKWLGIHKVFSCALIIFILFASGLTAIKAFDCAFALE